MAAMMQTLALSKTSSDRTAGSEADLQKFRLKKANFGAGAVFCAKKHTKALGF